MEDYPIIEYCNPCFPDIPFYKCTINGRTLHSKYLDRLINFRQDHIDNSSYYEELARLEAKAMATFMMDVKHKD